jgi:hypothetical protein
MTDIIIDAIYRYPVKGLSPERFATEALAVGGVSPGEAVALAPGR